MRSTSWPASFTGSGWRKNALTIENSDALTPIPKASVRTTTAA
jgi:hypothetical protein